ncbi:hypothetical protein CH63R_09644 [Colletotrichum higginsianum IMI 349063]|uniref:Uncharacterized protein n=1 Tax=Colletotrichum higginsianum (strain IMI 349063) TaxID=759273 RepID=A0A1B7Y7S7_COLHI|nr:hypothetical protein CH63R_09644 [Colletotrichum higginsianum IMI 349063]OBR08123.1 hypothetical protein CH63R_09644 [Colletotrichum higginsianum IMI 349063]
MVTDPSGSAELTRPSPSRYEHPWVVDRTPTRLDAEQAHRPLDPGLVVSFKHAMRNETARDAVYFDAETEVLVSAGSAVMDIHYPATLVLEAPPALPESVLARLLDSYCTLVHPTLPFLARVPAETLQPARLSGYLSCAMATMGSLAVQSPLISNAMPALLLADVLRSFHYGHLLTLSSLECLSGPA